MLGSSQHEGRGRRLGFTLIEMLVVMLIVALLAGGMMTLGGYVRQNAQIRSSEATIQLVTLALQEYQQHQDARSKLDMFPPDPCVVGAKLGVSAWEQNAFVGCWAGKFPSEETLAEMADHFAPTDFNDSVGWHFEFTWDKKLLDQEDRLVAARNSSEVMYWYLNDVAACAKVLARLPSGSKTNDNNNGITVYDEAKPLIEVVDSWGRPLRYRTLGAGNFPSVDSAGSDGIFDTADDVLSSEL